MSIGAYCRQYRIDCGLTLGELADGENIKTLSAFENDRSTNMNHLFKYIKLAIVRGDNDRFMFHLTTEVINHG